MFTKKQGLALNNLSGGLGSPSRVFKVDVTDGTGAADSNGSTLTYTRSGSAYVWDHEGVLRKAIANEVPQVGLRRVENGIPSSLQNTASPSTWADGSEPITGGEVLPVTVYADYVHLDLAPAPSYQFKGLTFSCNVAGTPCFFASGGVGRKVMFSIYMRKTSADTGNGVTTLAVGSSVTSADRTTYTVTLTTDWVRYSFSHTLTTNSTNDSFIAVVRRNNTTATCTSVEIKQFQMEDISGASVAEPGPFIHNTTTYNANVAGVKYLTTANGNISSGNVVTEGTGSDIDTAGMYIPVELNLTNDFTQPRDLSNAAWDVTAGLTSRTQNATGVGGVANACTTLVEDTGTSLHWVADTIAYTTGQIVTIVGCVAKASTSPYFYLGLLQGDGTTYKRAYFDTTTGALGTADSGVTSANAVSRGNFWEVFMTVSVGTVGSSPVCGVGMASADNTPSYLGSSKTLIVDAMTIDVVAGPTSPILDTGGATRSLPVYTYAAPTCISTAGKSWTIVLDILVPAASSRICQVTQDGSNYYFVLAGPTTVQFYSADTVNGLKSVTWTSTHPYRAHYKIVVRYRYLIGYEMWVNGTSRGTVSIGGDLPRHTLFRMATIFTQNMDRKISIYNGALSDARCVTESTV